MGNSLTICKGGEERNSATSSRYIGKGRSPRRLYAFDFDNTILDQDSLTPLAQAMDNLREVFPIPDELDEQLSWLSDMDYAQILIDYVTMRGISLDSLMESLCNTRFVDGMKKLLQIISTSKKSDSHLVIISGSFDYFIKVVLSNLNPPINPNAVISNIAVSSINNPGTLLFKPYEYQSSCLICPSSLCKGAALLKYVENHGPFDQHCYIGDGQNDYCPATKLGSDDLLFVRKGYELDQIIKSGYYNDVPIDIKARVVYFSDGKTIQQKLNLK